MTRHQPVMAACANRGEVLRTGHAAVHHHGGLGFVSHALLNDPEHLIHRRGVGTVAGEDFVGLGKAFRVEHQADKHLFAIRARIARVATLRLGVGQAQALEVGRGQIVKQDVFFERKEALFPPAERRFYLRSLGIKLVHVAVKPVFIESREVRFQNVAKRAAAHPLAHGQFRSRFDQPVEHHQLGQQARFVREPCFCEHLLQAKPLPDLMAHMHGAGLTGLLDFEGLGVKLQSP